MNQLCISNVFSRRHILKINKKDLRKHLYKFCFPQFNNKYSKFNYLFVRNGSKMYVSGNFIFIINLILFK